MNDIKFQKKRDRNPNMFFESLIYYLEKSETLNSYCKREIVNRVLRS